MKHSIKREQSHARMSFAECENQRSLAEGESNVRATLKHMKLSFHLILTLAVMLTMAQTAWADDVTWYMDGGKNGHSTCTFNANEKTAEVTSDQHSKTLRYTWTSGDGLSWRVNQIGVGLAKFDYPITNGCVVTFPDIIGTVTELTITNLQFFNLAGYTMKMYVGKRGATPTLLTTGGSDYLTAHSSSTAFTAAFTGSIDVDADHPLAIWFDGEELDYGEFTFGFSVKNNNPSPTIQVAYTPAAAPDAGHAFNISASGNVLTATCTNNEQNHQCITNHQATLTLNAEDGMASITNPVSASITPSLSDFNTDTQLGAICTIEYATQGSTDWTTVAPRTVGNYTARATVRINSTNYVLTKNFSVIEGHYITNDYPQFTINKTGAMAGKNVTVTFAPKMGESVATLTVTGDNTSLSLDNGISDNGDNTYTFAMPNENVTLGATFTFPTNANFTQNNNTYTIKNADGWDYFCQRIQYDANLDGFSGKTVELAANISVTTMAGMVHPFKGTFDGKGNTLTFNRTADAMYTAPFQNTNGATISNLHVEGTITGGTNSYISGLVGSSEGDLAIRDCHVSTQISTTFDSNTLSSNVGIGGIVGYIHYTTYGQKCQITGCVYDGLIYNPEYSGSTYGCGGFVGCLSEYVNVELTDCIFIEGQYDNNGGKHELLWGNDNNKNSTFFHRTNNQGAGTLTNCFFVATHFLKQGSPAVESATAPANFAHFDNPTDHRFLKVYGHTMVFDGKYYTPTYGDLVETYSYSGEKSYIIEYDDMPLGIKDVKTKQRTNYLRYNRPFTKDKAVTIMLPFDFTKNDIRRGEYDNILEGKFYEFAGMNGSTPVMEDANEVTEMKANTPYLFMPGENTNYLYFTNGDDYYQGINIFTEGYDGGTKEAAYDALKLVGTYSGMTWNAAEPETYILNDFGELEAVTDGTMVKPTSAYVITRNFLELANGADNSDDIETAAESGKVYEGVKLTDRTLFKDGTWNTLCLPFSLSAAQIAANANFAGATLMTMDVTKKNGFDTTDGTLYLWFKTATEIEAGVPYLVKWEKATDYDNNPSAYDISNPVFEGVTVSRTEAQTVESETTGLETVQMVGTYSPVSVTADDKSILFLGDANTLYYSTVDRQIRSCRAYFSVPYINGHAGAKARAFALSFDGEVTTGIIEVSANYNGVTDDAWYSLDGVRLSGKPTQRGMYINKGKKIIIK